MREGRWIRNGHYLTWSGDVRADTQFGKDVYGHVQEVRVEDGREFAWVRVEDWEGGEAAAAECGIDYDQAEFIDVVALSAVRDALTGETLSGAAEFLRWEAAEAAARERDARRAVIRAELRSGVRARVFTELDGALRTR